MLPEVFAADYFIWTDFGKASQTTVITVRLFFPISYRFPVPFISTCATFSKDPIHERDLLLILVPRMHRHPYWCACDLGNVDVARLP